MTGRVVEQPDLFEALGAVASDWPPSKVEGGRVIRRAISACAARHGGKVHIAWFRDELPGWIDPHLIGAVTSALHSTGHLVSAGEYLPNGGPSGNAAKPALVRLLVKPIVEKDFDSGGGGRRGRHGNA